MFLLFKVSLKCTSVDEYTVTFGSYETITVKGGRNIFCVTCRPPGTDFHAFLSFFESLLGCEKALFVFV